MTRRDEAAGIYSILRDARLLVWASPTSAGAIGALPLPATRNRATGEIRIRQEFDPPLLRRLLDRERCRHGAGGRLPGKTGQRGAGHGE